jgi:hypothetical protein
MRIAKVAVFHVDLPYSGSVYRLSGDRTYESFDASRIKACLADRQPGEWFLADANGGMTPEHTLVPVLLDELVLTEEDLIHAIHTNACDGVALKISKQGGSTPTRRQRHTAQFDAPIVNGGANAPDLPGLGLVPDMKILGEPVAVYEAGQ